MTPLIEIHDKCGLPIDLCICKGHGAPILIILLECKICGRQWTAQMPPGTPICDLLCVYCGKNSVKCGASA